MAKIVAVTTSKGGSGKTTISMQLAGTLARRGAKVMVVDADPQASALQWAAAAEDGRPFPASIAGLGAAGPRVHREVVKYSEDYDFIIVDCPPAVGSLVPKSALLVADLALIPVIPSPLDFRAALGIRGEVEASQIHNEELKAALVLNQVQPNTTLSKDALEVLPEFGLPLLKAHLSHRMVYRQSGVFGCSVHDLGPRASAAIAEVNALATEVLLLMERPSVRLAEVVNS